MSFDPTFGGLGNTDPLQQQQQQQDQFNPLDSIMANPQTTTIRGFHVDAQNNPSFALNFDTTSAEEQRRRRDRLARFEGGESNEQVQRLDYIEEQTKKAKSRLDRFVTQDVQQDADVTASITHAFPSIMSFENLAQIPDEQTQYELIGFSPSAPRRWDTIHLFGSRLLLQRVRTEDLLHRYRDDGLIKVEWQSDYRCNLVFADSYSARRVLDQESYVRDLDVAAAARHFPLQNPNKSDEENATSFEPVVLPFMVWRQSIFSEEDGTAKGSLSFRLATTSDVKEPVEQRKHSQFYLDNDQYFSDLLKHRKAKLAQDKCAQQDSESNAMADEAPVKPTIAKPTTALVAQKLQTEAATTALPARPVVVRPETTTTRGRGFAKGRVGAFDIDRTVVERPRRDNDRDDDGSETLSRQRDRNYGDKQMKPRVERDTPLMVTTEHLKSIEDRRNQIVVARQEREALRELRGGNHQLARTLLTKEEQEAIQQRETELSGRVHVERTYNPSVESLQRQHQLEMPQSGSAMMYQDINALDEAEKQQKMIRDEEERQKREADKAARKAKYEEEQQQKLKRLDEQLAAMHARDQEQRQIQAQQDAILAAQQAEQNAMMEEQARAEAAMGGNQIVNEAAEDDDYA